MWTQSSAHYFWLCFAHFRFTHNTFLSKCVASCQFLAAPTVCLNWPLFPHFSRTENPPPYASEGSLQKGPDSDRDSLDDYGEGPHFNEDGSFIEEYGDEKKAPPDEKDQSAFATFVWVPRFTLPFKLSDG